MGGGFRSDMTFLESATTGAGAPVYVVERAALPMLGARIRACLVPIAAKLTAGILMRKRKRNRLGHYCPPWVTFVIPLFVLAHTNSGGKIYCLLKLGDDCLVLSGQAFNLGPEGRDL